MEKTENLIELVPALSGKRILVVGDLMLDTYLIGDASRISPEAPVPVVNLKEKENRPGGAANCAMNISALGGIPVLVGLIGEDESGDRFLELIDEAGFDNSGIFVDSLYTTIRKTRVVASNQQIVRVDEEEKFIADESFYVSVSEFLEKIIPSVDAVAISDYAKGFLSASLMTCIHDISRISRIPVLVDPKPVNAHLYRGCDLIKPNRKEISEITGIDVVDDFSCDLAAEKLMDEITPSALLVTMGSGGMNLYSTDGIPERIRARVSRVYDVSGAGDTVLATLSLGYASGIDPLDSCKLASYAAAVAVTKPGTSTVNPDELIESIKLNSDNSR